MKITIVIPLLACTFSAASAQTTVPKTLLEIIKTKPASPFPASITVPGQSQAQLLSVTAGGKMYALPQDNMPCLVPNKTTAAVIPNAAPFVIPFNKMPNASGVHPVIPTK